MSAFVSTAIGSLGCVSAAVCNVAVGSASVCDVGFVSFGAVAVVNCKLGFGAADVCKRVRSLACRRCALWELRHVSHFGKVSSVA